MHSMTDHTPPTPQEIAVFTQKVQEDIQFLLSLYGLKVAVVHAPVVVPLTQSEMQHARQVAEERIAHALKHGAPKESELMALRALIDATKAPHLAMLRTMANEYQTATTPHPPTPPSP